MTTHRLKPTWCALAALILWTASALADVRLHSLFPDHMVLQRGQIVPIWGWADEGETVNVIFRGQIATTTAQNGKWIVYFPKQKAIFVHLSIQTKQALIQKRGQYGFKDRQAYDL